MFVRFAVFVCLVAISFAGLCAQDDEPLSPQRELELVMAAQRARITAIKKVYGSVVAIYGNDRAGGGSGVVFDSAGYALTNYHVVSGAGLTGWAGLPDGKLYRWKIVGVDPGGDVAIIQIQHDKPLKTSPLGDSSKVRVGDWSMAMGNPFLLAEDQRPTVTLGIVSGVERYQYGQGMNELVYGNCIQVDSSINPGNSGGPLYNLHGEVIGVNGRGSFEERGRVNVGLGYAISMNQIKKFIPDLMATKVAQHGSLDAIFTNRKAGVICSTMNLDSPIAALGLQLGDRLVQFENQPITNANQYTNLITTLPADWPVELVVDRGGELITFHSRLLALPYTPKPVAPPKPDGDKPAIAQPGPPNFGDAGKIRDGKQNRANTQELLAKASNSLGEWPEETAAVRVVDEVTDASGKTQSQEILIAADGRFSIHRPEAEGATHWGFDGETYWRSEGEKAETLSIYRAFRDPVFLQVAMLAQLSSAAPLKSLGDTYLEGGDKALGRVAYRLKSVSKEDWHYTWLSVSGDDGQPYVRVVKSGPDADSPESRPSVVWGDWRATNGLTLPWRRTVVVGLNEEIRQTMKTTSVDFLEEIQDDAFNQPTP